MTSLLSDISDGISQLVFPKVCVCCRLRQSPEQRQLCSYCLEERFADANPDNEMASSDTLLPKGVHFQHALWRFDKGGYLQSLLHQLKYHRLTTIGVDLGQKMAERVRQHPQIARKLNSVETIIVPVPLHYLKYRYRGFNQAFKVAQGFQKEYNEIPICNIRDIVRTKNTRTQTGFDLDQRRKNMSDAFEVRNKAAVEDKLAVIVDDVFTTGATTFELAQTLQKAGVKSVGILTIAQA